MNNPARYTVTSALPYANGPLHIGHLAGAYLPADIYVRYLRLMGKDVVWVCGSDEHGAAITLKAKKENTTPKAIIDKYHHLIKDTFKRLKIDFDIYHRTSEPIHYQTSQDIFLKLHEKGEFVVQESEQYFDEEAQQFLADRYITGTCPKCANPNAYGDQCEKCGSTLNPTDLIEPKSTISGSVPVLKKTKHWYLPLDKYSPWLEKWIDEKEGEWKINVSGQCKSWIKGGLQPRAMTRDLDWGIPVPLEEAKNKVLYVWLDAPIGYISATRQWAADNGKNWELYWKDKETKLVHFIGKDNIVFHCIIFPAILQAHGDYILPDNVPANEFMNLQGDKISTSRNWAVWAHEYVDELPGKEDELRYTLIANFPETKDSEFTWNDYQSRVNNELVATLGNFVNRVVVLTHKYFQGIVPYVNTATLTPWDHAIIDKVRASGKLVGESIEVFRFRDALNEMMELARVGNKYLGDQEPWKLIKTDEEAVQRIMYVALQCVAGLARIMQPFLPFAVEKLEDMLNIPIRSWVNADEEEWIAPGTQLGEAQILFTKIEDSLVAEQIAKLEASKAVTKSYDAVKETIQFDDFTKLDIRTGRILAAEKIEKAKKLLKLTVDVGFETRTIVSGIAEHFTPEEVIGTSVSVVVNLAPRELKGVLSQGMILMAEDEKGKLYFVGNDGVGSGFAIR
ncbi:MAG: methionine--tRNA ligase [Chitinophagales bacterium]|nr:methionine--tRNA ligase [Chitinophagales bacterium]